MRKNTLQKLLIAVLSITLLGSCSQIREVTTSANHKLRLHKVDQTAVAKVEKSNTAEKKSLNALPKKDQQIVALQEEKKPVVKAHPFIPPVIHSLISKESNTTSKTETGNKTLRKLDKAFDSINKVNRAFLPYGHSDANKFLWLWIGAAILAIIFYIIAVAAAAGGSAGGLVAFYILGVLCNIAAFVFFIVWLVKLFS